jgi:hypothetical protein
MRQMFSGPDGAVELRGRSTRFPKTLTAFRRIRALLRGDGGMSTAEYAIGTVAAAAFAALLYSVVTGDSVSGALTSLIQRALESSF